MGDNRICESSAFQQSGRRQAEPHACRRRRRRRSSRPGACRGRGDLEPEYVGDHLGLLPEGDRIVTHYFVCLDPAYHGGAGRSRWSAPPAPRTSRSARACCSPASDAMLSPAWVPWSDRLRPGDLGPGDLLPTQVDDPRLVPGFTATDDDADEDLLLGAGPRPSPGAVRRGPRRRPPPAGTPATPGRRHRWRARPRHTAPPAPSSFRWPVRCGRSSACAPTSTRPTTAGSSRVDHGCGAHSEAVVMPVATESAPPIVDELGYDVDAVRLADR